MHYANNLNVNGLSIVSIYIQKQKYDFITSYNSMTLNVV